MTITRCSRAAWTSTIRFTRGAARSSTKPITGRLRQAPEEAVQMTQVSIAEAAPATEHHHGISLSQAWRGWVRGARLRLRGPAGGDWGWDCTHLRRKEKGGGGKVFYAPGVF